MEPWFAAPAHATAAVLSGGPQQRLGLTPLAAIDALCIRCKELLTGFAIDAHSHLAKRGEKLVECTVHRVNREVAGEHAAVDTEGLDRVLEPGRKDGGAHRPERHREARQLANYVVAQAGQRVDAGPPEGALLFRFRARPSGVLDDNDQIIEAG